MYKSTDLWGREHGAKPRGGLADGPSQKRVLHLFLQVTKEMTFCGFLFKSELGRFYSFALANDRALLIRHFLKQVATRAEKPNWCLSF